MQVMAFSLNIRARTRKIYIGPNTRNVSVLRTFENVQESNKLQNKEY